MYIIKNKILLFILSIILFNLYFPHAVGATFIDTLSPAQREALQRASDADEDIQELIEKKRIVVDATTDGIERTEGVGVMNELIGRLRDRGEESREDRQEQTELF